MQTILAIDPACTTKEPNGVALVAGKGYQWDCLALAPSELQNRVDPSGQLHVRSERGAWLGNRGILHDEQTLPLVILRV